MYAIGLVISVIAMIILYARTPSQLLRDCPRSCPVIAVCWDVNRKKRIEISNGHQV